MMTKEEALADLADGLREHLKKVADNVLTSALDERSIAEAVKIFMRGFDNAREFYDQVSAHIEDTPGLK